MTPRIAPEDDEMRTVIGLTAAAILAFGLPWAADGGGHGREGMDGASLHPPEGIRWKDGPPSLPPGAKFAVLEGDPSKNGPFVFRVKVPDGYAIPPHTHPRPERVTVISGTFHIGMGEKPDKGKARPMRAGTYGTWPAGMKHFVWVKGETVVQFHGDGPWEIEYVDPRDDPRKR